MGYVELDEGIHKGRSKVTRNEKWKQNYMGFRIHKMQ